MSRLGLPRRLLVRPTVVLLAAAVVAAVVSGLSVVPAAAQPEEPDAAPLAQALLPDPGLDPAGPARISPRIADARGPVTAFVELDRPAVVDTFTAARRAGEGDPAAEARQARTVVGTAADSVIATLRGSDSDARELYRTANAVPGIAVVADAAQVRELGALPQVRSIRKVVPKTRNNAGAVQLTRALQVWQQTGRFGDGVRIGIIDDGIDYTHANYGGPGTPEAYAAIDRTVADPAVFPTPKVVGGFDFVGDEYDAAGTAGPDAIIPQPDPNPLSCGEHGNHVAGSAAGFGVTADGSTFTGNYGELDEATLESMRIGPGAAPRAQLVAFKIFGCAGSTNVTALALDRALDPNGDGDLSDKLDVVNLSLGYDFGPADDPDSLFIRRLAENGVLSVISVGNGGDIYDIGGAPGSTPEALTVASTRDAFVLRDGIEVTAPSDVAGVRAGQYSVEFLGYDTLDLTAPVVALTDPANLDGCDPISPADATAVAGKIVWLEWDDDDTTRRCGSAVRADNAQAAGAAGVLLTSALEQFTAAIAGNAGIPQFQLTGPATAALRPALEAGTLVVRLAGELRTAVPTEAPSIVDTPSEFTSRGIRAPAVKPDVAAPGDTIASALVGSGDGVLVISGTSMAAPHVAGISALVREEHPRWTVEEIKAAVMNTAGADVFDGEGRQPPVHAPNRVGAGRVDARSALGTDVVAMVQDAPGHVSVGFGVVEAAGPTTLTKTVEVVNKGGTAASYSVGYEPITTIPGVVYELSESDIEVGPGNTERFDVTLRIDDPAALRKTADPTIEKVQVGVPRQFLADASGRIVLRPQGGAEQELRVPVYAAPKPVAAIETADELPFRGRAKQAVLDLSGRGLDQGTGDEAYRSIISVLQLQEESPRLPECGDEVMTDCIPIESAAGADLRHVGVTSTAPLAVAQGRPEDALLAFGITTWGNWSSIGGIPIPFVDIDTTGDGVPDFEIVVTRPEGTDVLVAQTVDLAVEGFPAVDTQPVNTQFGDVDTGVFNTNALVLPVRLAALGIDPAAPTAPLTYSVGMVGLTGPADTDEVVDTAGPVFYDAVRPALTAQGGGEPAVAFLARPGTALVVRRDEIASLTQPSGELLVIHHHNATGDRVQVVDVRAPLQLPPPGLRPVQPQPVPVPVPVPSDEEPAARPAEPTSGPAPPVQPMRR